MMYKNLFWNIFLLLHISNVWAVKKYTKDDILRLREEVRAMFQHAYSGYLRYASDYDELRPLTCDGVDTWGSYSLTLIDALDTLATMGNFTEFRRVSNLIVEKMNFDNDINVSVFETNIRIVGGLISAHLMSNKVGLNLEEGWPCNGPLLRMAEDVARRLLPAFDTNTGMPYGTVNLKFGVPRGETPVTCTAGVGTFIVEFGALSRLTGNPIYEEVALNAIYSLWKHRSPIGLLGNHIDVQSGRWTAQDAGIGAGVDSFYEYLVKGSIMLNRPDLLQIFHEGRKAIDKYLKRDDWYVWVGMNKGQVTLPVFQSLEAYWPGVLSLVGDVTPAFRTLYNYYTVWKQYGFLPEFYNIPGGEAGTNRENYPLRPELVESAMYLYRMTKDPFLLEIGESMLRSIQYSAKTSCGYATIQNVRDHRKENRMESFFLAETTKYLYMLFDETNFLHNDGHEGKLLETPNGQCVVNAGSYIFNTEAHPIDMSALYCCYDLPRQDIFADFNISDYHGDVLAIRERRNREADIENSNKFDCASTDENKLKDLHHNISVEIQILDENLAKVTQDILSLLGKTHKLNETQFRLPSKPYFSGHDFKYLFGLTKAYFSSNEDLLKYVIFVMKTYTVDQKIIHSSNMTISSVKNLDEQYSIWDFYKKNIRLEIINRTVGNLGLTQIDDKMKSILNDLNEAVNSTNGKSYILKHLTEAKNAYHLALRNTTAMQEFLITINTSSTTQDKNQLLAKPFLTANEIVALKSPLTNSDEKELVYDLIKLIKHRTLIMEQIHKMQSLAVEINETMTEISSTNDDIIVVNQHLQNAVTDNSTTASQVQVDSESESKATTESYFKPLHNHEVSWKNNSLLVQFMQTILKSTIPTKRTNFNLELFTKKVSTNHKIYLNITQNYELLTCPAPPFKNRFSYRLACP